jgi:protein phosphatase 1 regulatory subunit 42
MSGLDKLVSLEKLYIGYNAITVVEGIHELRSLRELHVEHQRLPRGQQLEVDPRVGDGLGRFLRTLNLAGNRCVCVCECVCVCVCV